MALLGGAVGPRFPVDATLRLFLYAIVADSGEGRWTAIEAVEQGIPAPVMSLALMMRFASQGSNDYGSKLVALMRAGFGGHAIQHDNAGAGADDGKAKGN